MVTQQEYTTWSKGRGSRLRLPKYPPGFPVHVVIGTRDTLPVFANEALAEVVVGHLTEHPRTRVACLMPDHLHWLLSDCSDLVGTVRRFKSLTTHRAWSVGHRNKLWQRSFFDTVLRTEKQVRDVAEYIVANPVRAGLVESVREYPWICGRDSARSSAGPPCPTTGRPCPMF